MKIDGWKYYKHAMVPSTFPHEQPNTAPVDDGSIWKSGKASLLARWTTDFDCGYETNWWYVIKDTPFDIDSLKAKRRYEINKGNKNFYVKEITSIEVVEDLYEVAAAAYATYPKSYRPNIDLGKFRSEVEKWNFYKVYGAYAVEDDSLCGYACLNKINREGNYINFTTMKAVPEKERLGLNAAMVNKILVDHVDFLSSGGYISDGARSINHETAFQDYLEKYFGFRKAYCKLHIVYRPYVRVLVKIFYPFRKILKKIGFVKLVGSFNALLQMEEINRTKV